jgi:hypothetical protein
MQTRERGYCNDSVPENHLTPIWKPTSRWLWNIYYVSAGTTVTPDKRRKFLKLGAKAWRRKDSGFARAVEADQQ